jgi:hypothetical protein
MKFEIDNVTTFNRIRTKRDITKVFYRYLNDIETCGAHATLVIQHNAKGETTAYWGTTKEI